MPFSMGMVTRRKVAIVIHCQLPRRHDISRKRRVRSAPPLTSMMKYAVPAPVPALLALLTLQHQPKLNPAPLWCFAAATTIYWLISGVFRRRKTTNCFHTLRIAALASGILSALSLLSMFLPHPVSLLPLLIWLLIALIWAIYRSTILANIKASAIWARARGLTSKNQTLPV